jgi:hypothetical protein
MMDPQLQRFRLDVIYHAVILAVSTGMPMAEAKRQAAQELARLALGRIPSQLQERSPTSGGANAR